MCLTLKRLGGGGPLRPPSTFRVITLQRTKLSPWHFMTILLSSFPHIFDSKFVTPGGTVLKLRNFLYMLHVGPIMAPKCDFVYKINANWVFLHSSYKKKYAYFYSQLLKLICFSIYCASKSVCHKFRWKKQQKQKVKETEKYIRNS